MIAELHCTPKKNKVQEHYVQKTGEKPNADREHIFYFNNFFFSSFAQNKGAGHTAFEPRRRTSYCEDCEDLP